MFFDYFTNTFWQQFYIKITKKTLEQKLKKYSNISYLHENTQGIDANENIMPVYYYYDIYWLSKYSYHVSFRVWSNWPTDIVRDDKGALSINRNKLLTKPSDISVSHTVQIIRNMYSTYSLRRGRSHEGSSWGSWVPSLSSRPQTDPPWPSDPSPPQTPCGSTQTDLQRQDT